MLEGWNAEKARIQETEVRMGRKVLSWWGFSALGALFFFVLGFSTLGILDTLAHFRHS
jgi:hypothetical protein